jgi:hypothetical protein
MGTFAKASDTGFRVLKRGVIPYISGVTNKEQTTIRPSTISWSDALPGCRPEAQVEGRQPGKSSKIPPKGPEIAIKQPGLY